MALARESVPLLQRVRRAATEPLRHALLRLSPAAHARLQFRRALGVWPDLHAPRTFNEKATWLMLYDHEPLRATCSDKFAMRTWVKQQGLGHLLPRLYAVWDRADDVDIRGLPDRFFLKCTHGCGFNIACRDRASFDVGTARRKLARWMEVDYSLACGEPQYARLRPRIVCEEYFDDHGLELPVDYKAYVFHGRVHCFAAGTGRTLNGEAVWEAYDATWTSRLDYYEPRNGPPQPPPASLQEMLDAAAILGRPFPFVRIDFYDIAGRARLGELSFTPAAARDFRLSAKAEKVMGELLVLPGVRPGGKATVPRIS